MGLVLGVFFNPIIGTTHNMTCSVRSTVVKFVRGVSATTHPRLARTCTYGSCDESADLVFDIDGIYFVVLCVVMLPIKDRVRCILRL